MKGEPVTQSTEVSRQDLPFEFMLNALRLLDGFVLADYVDRTGLAMTSIQKGLIEAEKLGLIERDLHRAWPTDRGFDFLSDLQALFLADIASAQAQ
jgi:oxygen-independent coproporphyrinogen-3 oxidase